MSIMHNIQREVPTTLHARIAAALGWPEEETKRLPLQALRELVRPISAKLAYLITDEIRSGRYIIGEPLTWSER